MNRKTYINSIISHLARFKAEVELFTDASLYDINLHAENVLIPMLDILYGLNLRNANEGNVRNFPAIDLYDKVKRVAFQISATPDTKKVTDSLTKFGSHGLDQDFDTLYIFVLRNKRTSYPKATINASKPAGLSFDIKRHIIGFSDIGQKVMDLADGKALQRLADICAREFADVTDDRYSAPGFLDIRQKQIKDKLEEISAASLEEANVIDRIHTDDQDRYVCLDEVYVPRTIDADH